MQKRITIWLILLAGLCVAPVFAQDCKEFRELIAKTYNFKPSKLTPAERNAKSAAMDVVWETVKADQKTLVPCLREAIKASTADGFFKFDASNLLIQLDQSDAAKKTLINAYAEVDFNDIDPRYWLPYMAILGYQGFDTSAAGENWMKYPDPGYLLPQHGGLAVTKQSGAFILYGAMDEAFATPALVKIAANENHPARAIAVEVLLQQLTPEAFQAMKKLNPKGLPEKTLKNLNALLTKPNLVAPREGPPKTTRQQYLDAFEQLAAGKPQTFLKLAADIPDGEKDVIAVMKPEDIPLIRRARRTFMASANPHSQQWYESFTNILLAMTWKPEPASK